MAVEKKITPTLTLAQLYDAQKQYFDSFLIYHQLYQENKTEDLKSRLDNAQAKIFTDNNLTYNDTINIIFNDEDKMFFKIIPENQYKNYKAAVQSLNAEEIELQEEEFDEEIFEMDGAEEIEEEFIQDFNQEIKTPKTNHFIKKENLMDYNISELSDYIIKLLGSNKKLANITISELKEIKKLFKDIL